MQNIAISHNKKPDARLIWILAGIAVVTCIVYLRAIGNGFTTWDDDEYIISNPIIRSLNLKIIFTHLLSGNYHPLTELVLAVEYHFWGLNEKAFHTVSLLLHICNSLLVFVLILQLSRKKVIAIVTCLLFAIHPMHVESVAWASELKDLLYSFFFLTACIFYLKCLKDIQKQFYFISLLLFLFALLSKAMAVSLPVLLLLIDYFIGRKITRTTLLEKVPFFALSVIFGIVAVLAQRSAHAIQDVSVFPLQDRLVFACYGFVMYLYKLILPVNLCAFYPYPTMTSAGIPSWYYIFPLLFLLLVAVVYHSTRYTKKLFFGIGFFAITVFLVLQLLPVGSAIMADRYSYIPSIGIFYLAGEGFYWLWNKKRSSNGLRIPAMILLISTFVFFSLTTYARCGVWKSGMTIWNDVISKFKDSALAYASRGNIFSDQKKYDEAKRDFDKAIALSPDFSEAYNNRGILYMKKEQYEEAMNDFNMAIKLQPDDPLALNNRGIIFSNQKKYEEAKKDFDKAIEYDNANYEAYNSMAVLFANLKKNQEARDDYDRAIALNPDYFEAYDNRGVLSKSEQKYDDALADFDKAIALNPNFVDAYNHRSALLLILNRKQEAQADFDKALTLNPGNTEASGNRESLTTNENNDDEAMNSYNKAIALNPSDYSNYYNRSIFLRNKSKNEEAIRDLTKVIELNNNYFKAYYDRASILMDEKKYTEALADLDKAIALNPHYSEAYNNRGIIFSTQKKYEAAKKNFDKAIEYKNDYNEAYVNRGLVLMEEEKYEEAISDFNKTIELHFNSPEVYYNKAKAEFSLGKKEAGCKDLQQAVNLKFQPAEDAFNHLCH